MILVDEQQEFIRELAQGLAQEERYAKEHDTTLSPRSVRECREVTLQAVIRYFVNRAEKHIMWSCNMKLSSEDSWEYAEVISDFFKAEYKKELKKDS